ncbi:MAG: glycoside hydrolase family 2 [Candidatus Hydrogenedentes bacterium]|nr:glycoside hydrolase family 2 [Candidatus Hydrogenedentota bacterium]
MMLKHAPALLLMMSLLSLAAAADDLERRFQNPPEATKPRCYWYWMDGHISKEGVTRDLEAMRHAGIGGAYIGVISGESGMEATDGPPALSDEWWAFIEHAVREGGRLGIDIGVFNSPGWSQSGGPWVRPEQAMRHVMLPETRLRGPQHFEGKLPAPEGPFQDVAVLAFPAPAGDGVAAAETARTPRSVSFDMAEPFTARSVTVRPVKAVNVSAELLVSDDGREFRPVKKFTVDRHNINVNVGPVPLAPVIAAFPAVTARHFRLDFSGDCEVGEVLLSPAARVESHAEKSLQKMFQDPLPPFDFYSWEPQAEPESAEFAVDAGAVLDLGGMMREDGTLVWDVPEGDWLVLRAVMAPTGTKNAPSPPEATGLEVDKMSRAALKTHFDAYVGNLLDRMPPEERTALKYVVADSYEMGPQNWTDGFAERFQARYGYDPVKWLPALTGRVVGGTAQTDRFLWDLRRLVADMVSDEYVGGLSELCNAQGLKMWLENYGHWGFPGEFLQYGGACDEISGEFWVTGDLGTIELRDAASAAHIYGKPVVWAEAFTGGPAFANAPRDLKARGDWAFCEGINQFVLHVNIHQPWEDKKPGINAWFGTEFNRHNTWFNRMQPWVDYLRRSTVMLQSGLHVADVAYFIGEDAPKMAGERRPALPAGHDYDYINADVIEHRLEVRDGRFVLPDGMSYRLLVLPESKTMRPALLKKIKELAAAGGAVFGPAPERSPSLENYPACDAEVAGLAAELWGGGKVMSGDSLDAAFAQLGLTPDVVCPDGFLWKHRRDGDRDVYFLTNQTPEARSETISFRVDSRLPELWWPETGRIGEAPAFTLADGRVDVPIHFDMHGSVFVVFQKPAKESRTAAPAPAAETVLTQITGPWKVEFPGGKETFKELVSWHTHSDPAIKYFSGEAVYRTTFDLSGAGEGALLDLGEVHALAVVAVNGREVATLWKSPYRVDIGPALRPGKNELAVTVVNTWNNRLVGDAQRGAKNPTTFITTKSVKFNTPLQPSGLLGPVRLVRE